MAILLSLLCLYGARFGEDQPLAESVT